jgi:acyl-CoA thioester hydrolase
LSSSGEGVAPGWVHSHPVQVQFDEVDQYGIVHHTRYLIYFERARVQLMGRLGMRAGQTDELGLIVARADARFLKPARFLDELTVLQGCRRAGASRIELSYRIVRGDDVICTAELTLAFVGKSGRPCRAPAYLREGLTAMGTP